MPARPLSFRPIVALLVGLLVSPLCGCGDDPQRLAGSIHIPKDSPPRRARTLPPKVQAKMLRAQGLTNEPTPTTPRPEAP